MKRLLVPLVLAITRFATAQIEVQYDTSNVTHIVNPLFMGCHSDSGYTHEPRGFYAQMVLGESFETLPPDSETGTKQVLSAVPNGTHAFKNAFNNGRVRHCDFQLYSDTAPQNNPDFFFSFGKGLDGSPDSISIQSTNFPGKYIGVVDGAEPGRCGIVKPVSNAAATFTVVPPLDTTVQNGFSLTSNDPATKGQYLAINGLLKGGCSNQYPSTTKDVALMSSTDAIFNNSAATWSLDDSMPPPPPPPHSYSAWNEFVSPGVDASFSMDSATPFHGLASQMIQFHSGQGVAAVGNRGLGNEGLYIESGKDYEGYFFAKAGSPVTLVAQLIDHNTNKTLATMTIPFAGGNWTMLNFTLTTTSGTTCVDGENDPTVSCGKFNAPSHICVSCGGQFQVGLSSPGSVNIDYVYLQPGEWGRVNGLGVLKSGVDTLKSMGVTAIRLGGSFTDPSYYFWKLWRGKPWERPSLGAEWGKELISGWGPFEFIDMCNAAGIEPVMTTTGVCDACTPEDMGDLIEYTHGGPNTTWGALRIQDGHPDPYDVKFFELGNEQYNPMYADQVANMEARAKGLGLDKTMFYMNPNNARWLTPADAAKVEAVGIKDHAVMDEHVGGGGGVEIAKSMFEKFPNYTMGAVNAETNAGIHTMSRAMMEANDLNDWFSCSESWCSRLHFRTASFCTERSGHFDAFDQGISFFLPNMSWLQPPGYVHKMIGDTWASKGLAATVEGGGSTVSAQLSDDGKTAFIRLASTNGGTVKLISGGKPVVGDVNATTMSASSLNAANAPANPAEISPQQVSFTFGADGTAAEPIPPNSFTVFTISL